MGGGFLSNPKSRTMAFGGVGLALVVGLAGLGFQMMQAPPANNVEQVDKLFKTGAADFTAGKYDSARKAFVDAVMKARPIVLEPIVKVEITAPDGAMGDITGDLSAKRGQVSGTQNLAGGSIVVNGQVPLSELSGYQARLNGMTGGQGRYTLALSHYEAVPPTVQAQLSAQFKPREDD